MASVAFRRGYGWSLPGMTAAQARGKSSSAIRVFSAKGLGAPGVLGTSPLMQIGVPIAGTGLLYVKPRLSQDEGLGGGGGGSQFYVRAMWPGGGGSQRVGPVPPSAVHITNPQYSFYRRYQRTPSIGMAAAGQMGRSMDVPWQSDTPYFSVA